jgi:hypothetical protein
MSKHTPGPWASNKYTTSVSVPLKAIDCERIGFSIVFVNGHREKEAAANARLIAAAPDLLEALKYHQEQTRPIQRTLDVIKAAEGEKK